MFGSRGLMRKNGKRRLAVWARPCLEWLEARQMLTGTWTELTNKAPDPYGITDLMLLSDGNVMAQGSSDSSPDPSAWYRLTPDSTGSYVNGSWSTMAPMHVGRIDYTKDLLLASFLSSAVNSRPM